MKKDDEKAGGVWIASYGLSEGGWLVLEGRVEERHERRADYSR